MNNKNALKKLANIVTLYNDYLEHGTRQEKQAEDISFMDIVENEYQNIGKKASLKTNDISLTEKKRNMIKIAENILNCKKCFLHNKVKKVPGSGNVIANLFVISTPATSEEEKAGKPLFGNTGDFFNKWLKSIDIDPEEIFITNLIKCPPKNNKISKNEINACRDHLDAQLKIIKPLLILALGQLTASSLKQASININKNHGKVFDYNGIPFIATFHPSEVLSDKSLKKDVWDDLKKIKGLFFK